MLYHRVFTSQTYPWGNYTHNSFLSVQWGYNCFPRFDHDLFIFPDLLMTTLELPDHSRFSMYSWWVVTSHHPALSTYIFLLKVKQTLLAVFYIIGSTCDYDKVGVLSLTTRHPDVHFELIHDLWDSSTPRSDEPWMNTRINANLLWCHLLLHITTTNQQPQQPTIYIAIQ